MIFKGAQSMEHFTEHANQSLQESIHIAVSLKITEINPYIFLYALSLGKGSIAAEILKRSPLNQKALEQFILLNLYIDPKLKKDKIKAQEIIFNSKCQEIILKSFHLARQYRHNHIGTEHLLIVLIETLSPQLKRSFKLSNDFIEKIKKQINIILNGNNKFPEILEQIKKSSDETSNTLFNKPEENMNNNNDFEMPKNIAMPTRQEKQSILDSFCVELSSKEVQFDIDPVIGRNKEIHRISQILCRRNKNNPVLLGDPGVGKTAIIEGLAKNILEGKVPSPLLNKKIYALDLTALISGTMYRGEFEGRIKRLIDEISERNDIILFIDELHNIMGAGSTSGSMDVANILKPALARGQIRCIGATTYEEYKKYIEKDAALDRRFQSVDIREPSPKESIQILEGIKINYENYHRVSIKNDAIYSAVNLSVKYLTNQFLPDKAIDLIDEAAANLSLKVKQNPLEKKLFKLEDKLVELQSSINLAISQEEYSEAISIQTKENKLLKDLEKVQNELDKTEKKPIGEIDSADIIEVLAQKLNVKKEEIALSDKKVLNKLAKNLKNKILGQENLIDTVSENIIKAKAGITDHNRPLASFIFVGPSGTGKTALAKQLAEELFANEKALIRVDMTEFSESFNISKLIGAPAGYVGFREENKLTDRVKKQPYSVILFDEIEKAHPQVFNLLLPVLDEGYLTDATGKQINFRNSIIIFTSNLGSKELGKKLGFGEKENQNQNELEENYQKSLKKFFAPEFLNRLDNILVFNSLDKKALNAISKQKLEKLKVRLKERNFQIQFSPRLSEKIVELVKNDEQEARGIEQIIRDKIENKLAQFIMANKKIELNGQKHKIFISYKNKEFTFSLK